MPSKSFQFDQSRVAPSSPHAATRLGLIRGAQ